MAEVIHKTLNIKLTLLKPELFKHAKDDDIIECSEDEGKIIRKFLKSFLTLVPEEKKKDNDKESKVSKPVSKSKVKAKKQVDDEDEEDSDEIEDVPMPKELNDNELDIRPEVKEEDDDE